MEIKDLDNDDEWLSDEEEEFQREQEAKLQAAQKRALAETESLSDEDQTPEQYQQRFEQKFDKEDDWSDEDVGFQGRNAPLRKSMNRASYSADESSEEEIMITSAPQQHQEPGREEMDMMVKKNLAYVNSNDLDQMDIMTSDLDIPESQLKLPDGVGEFVQAGDESYDYEKTHDMEAKEDSDNEDHPEAVGSLEVVGNSVIVADVKEVPSYSENVDRYTEENSHIARLDSDDQAASRTELISALAEDLKESDQSDMTSKVETVGSGIIEEDVSPTNKHEEETKVDAATLEGLPNTADDSRDRPHFNEDYSTQVIRPNRKSGWRRQLSEKLNEWEDELPSPSRPSGDFAVGSEAITSFMSGDEVEEREVNPSTDAGHIPVEKTKTTEVEIREKVEDSMHDKIRDWKNRTAESVAGQVDEWQSLGNFNIPNPSHEAPQGRRRAHEDAVEDNMPAEKRRDLDAMQGAVDDNAVLVQSISYDGDAEGADEREDDKARADDSDDEMEGDGEGYISESSSQDTVRERSLHRQSLPINTGSLSDDESLESPAAEIPLPDTADESGYVEILGGEEPPDEWMNLGTRRERVSSSSSSSDGSGFQFVSAEVANQRQHDRQSAAEEQLQQLGGQRVSDVPRQRLSTPPLDLPVATHPPVEDIIQETAYSERQYSMPRDSEVKPVKSVKEKETVEYDRMPTEPMSPMSHSPGEVLTDDEEVTEVASHQRIEELAQPELAAAPVEEAPVQKPRRESPKSDDPPEVVHKDAVVGRDEQAPQPTTRKDSYDRVEKLRKEMRTASSSGQTQSFDVQMTRQGRTAERFTERMMSFEKSKAMREKKTLAPPGLSGKFSSVFSRFETDDGSRAKRPQRQDIRRSKSTGPPARRNRDRSVESPETVQPTRVNTESSQPRRSQVLTRSKSQSREGEKSRLPERRESVEERRPEPRAKRIERSKTFDTGIPNRSPSGRKVIERMAKFGDASDARKSHQETVTTRNSGNERYDMTADGLRPKSSQPHFDVDIQIRREPDESDYHKRRSARRDKVRAASEERREEYLNVWDTEVPVRDEKRKVISPKRLHVTSVSRTIRPSTAQDQTRDELPISSSSSEPKIRQKSPTLQHEEVSVTVRPQQAVTQSSAPRRSRDTQAAKVEQSRMRSSIALRPTDDIIQPKQTSRQNAEPQRKSRAPERDRPWKKADSLEDLRSGSLVAQCKGKFDTGHSHPYQFLPGENKAFSNRRNEPSYTRGGSERQETMSDAVRDLTDAYDQMEDAEDYDIGYSRESLEYTRKWIENNETTPDMRQSPDVIQPPGRDRVADPRRDDANYRRMQRGNIRDVPKHYIMPSRAAVEPASPEPSVVSERGRARSMEGNRSASTGRPKGRSRSVPRKKPAKAIADRASVFSNPSDEPPMTRPDIEEHIKAASSGRFMQGNPSSRRSASPRPVTQKERLANRRSMPPPTELIQQQRQPSGRQQREPTEEEQRSPRAASKGVAMMIELYNKNKARDSALADVDEQTLASVDDDMFRHSSMPTSPPVDQTPAAAQAWKAWRGQVDRSGLEQKIEHAYSRHTQPAGPPVKRESKPLVSGWQQRSVLEERLVHPVSASQSYSAQPAQHSPPRPAKSNVAMDAQRKGWSTSPPAPAIPHRGYSAEPEHSGVYNGGQPADNAFDSYKQQTLQRFRQEEQYATVQRASRPEPPRQLPVQAPNTFDQALLMQAPPPKPERLYNKAEPWEAYPPNEYLTTNQLQGYQQRPPAQQPNDMRVPARYADERPQYAGYPSDRPASQRDPRYRDHPPPPQQQRPHPVPQARYDDRGYPAQPMHQAYREPDYPPPPKQNYPTAQSYREPGHDSRPYGPGREPYHHGYGDQPDGYRPAVRKEVRYPHEQPPRGPIPDPRYGQSNGIRSPPPQQANPRYGAFDPRMETGGRPPRRTNSVPNIKQQVTSPSKPPAPLHPYNPRYHDQYIEERQRQQTNAQHESLPRSSKKDKSSKKNKEKSSLPEFIPIQYATGKQASKAAPQNGYSGHPKYVQNNNYPPGNNRYTHPSEQGYTHNGYPPSGHPYPSNGHPDYPPRHGYHPGAHHGYHHDDPYAQRTRPGVGVIYNPDLGVSDF
ncbi:microtubule-associated protein futsch-like isoform X3 [Watersipora subatra]|uniref:microtubule-associated protein futsch-like isoform X3 n=1 Tax=Watersipora subatra TaxID=2589382 RepID=UPI00355B79D4